MRNGLAFCVLWGAIVVGVLADLYSQNPFEELATKGRLSPLPVIWTVPIEVSLYVIGLEGNGHLGVNISHAQLQQWLEHLDSTVAERLIASIPDRFSTEQAPGAHSSYKEFSPVIQYKYHYHLITLSPEVTKVIEMVLERNFRDDGDELQINPRIVENTLESLLDYIIPSVNSVEASAFSLFVLNPHKNWAGGLRYGYRDGLSEEEARVLIRSSSLMTFARSRTLNQTSPTLSKLSRGTSVDGKRIHTTVSQTDQVSSSFTWAENMKKQLSLVAVGPITLQTFLETYAPNYKKTSFRNHSSLFDSLSLSQDVDSITENCLLDVWVGSGRLAFVDLAAGPFEWGPAIGGEGLRSKDSLPNITTFLMNASGSKIDEAVVEPKFDWDMIEAEKVILEDFLAAECANGESTPECVDLKIKLEKINRFMSKEQPVDKVAEDDFEHANAFSFFTHESGQSAHSDSLIQHQFLGHLNAMLSSSLRHLVTPTISHSPDLSTTFAPRVVFHVYILRNHNNDVGLASMIAELQAALESIRLPFQVFSFATRTLNMDDDPRLALAFTSSLRSATIPSLSPMGLFDAEKRMYLDSKSLEFELTRIDDEEDSQPKNDHHAKDSREIPIFIFSLDDSYLPVLVDKYYQSQVVGGLVVATQSTYKLWKSDLMCNGKPIMWDLRHPIKAIVQSTLQVLTGIVPTHVQAGGSLNRITNDWRWSVGAHACAFTGSGTEISQLQADIAHRTYITSAIRFAHVSIQASLERLMGIRLPRDHAAQLWNLTRSYAQIRSAGFNGAQSVLDLYEMVQQNMSALAECVASPTKECLEEISRFTVAVKVLTRLLSEIYEGALLSICDVPPRISRIGAAGYLVAGSICLVACLRTVFVGFTKPKINQD